MNLFIYFLDKKDYYWFSIYRSHLKKKKKNVFILFLCFFFFINVNVQQCLSSWFNAHHSAVDHSVQDAPCRWNQAVPEATRSGSTSAANAIQYDATSVT